MELTTDSGKFRCHHKNSDGEQCTRKAVDGYDYCRNHGAPHPTRRNLTNGRRYTFKTERVNAIYGRMRDDPEYLSVRDELAMVRTACQSVIEAIERRIEDDETARGLTERQAMLISSMAQDAVKIASMANRIEKGLRAHISIEGLDAFLGTFLDVVMKEVKDDSTLERIREKLKSIEVPTGEVGGPFIDGIDSGQYDPYDGDLEESGEEELDAD